MTQDIQDTLLQLFERVRHDPDTPPTVLLDGWQEESTEWRLLESFRSMLEHMHERIRQLRQAEQQLREREEQYRSIFEAVTNALTISRLEDGQCVEANPAACFAPNRARMAVPMLLKERVMGVLNFTSREPNYFTSRHAALALGIANQAAIAIENARLYAQAQELAALEERQKLARELHDSVSQALYGISLGAHTARTALEREPGEVAEPLDYVLMLAEAAMAEMRALIFELCPESLETEGLVAALSKQAAALQARHELTVLTELCDEPALSLRVKQELYRIAQEAMHNTVKHARASQVVLRLVQTAQGVTLEVRDDGVGFDPSASFPGHLGLHSMRERVVNLGGTLQMESTPGQGTTIRAHVPTEAC